MIVCERAIQGIIADIIKFSHNPLSMHVQTGMCVNNIYVFAAIIANKL